MNGHLLFSSLHAVAAVIALVYAIVALQTGRGVRIHLYSCFAMAALLIPSMWFGWSTFDRGAKPAFVGLLVLAWFMVWQTVRADRIAARVTGSMADRMVPSPDLVRVIGFNVVALLIAGTIVPVIRLGGGPIGLVVCILVMLAIGHVFVENRRARAQALVTTSS